MRVIPPKAEGFHQPPLHPVIMKGCSECSRLFKSSWNNHRQRYVMYCSRECLYTHNRKNNLLRSNN